MKSDSFFYISGDEYCIKVTDGTHYSPKSVECGNYLVTSKHIKGESIDFSSAYLISKEDYDEINLRSRVEQWDVIISMIGAYCGFCFIESNPDINYAVKNVGLFKAGNELNAKWLYYYLSSPVGKAHLEAGKLGSTQPYISLGSLRKLPILTPRDENLKEKIVRVLDSIQQKISINNHIKTELEVMAKTLYDYWFVQFDFPDSNGKPYKTSGGKMVYNTALKREIPAGWEVKNIGAVARTELGGTPSTAIDDYWENANIPWLSSSETASFPVISSEQMITQSGIDNSAATLLPKGTVVISIVRYIRPSILGLDAATNQSVVGIRENRKFKSSFIYPYFCHEVPRLMGLRTGAQQPHINKGTIDNSPIVIPPAETLASYYSISDAVFEKIMTHAFQIDELKKLRDWLLPLLMNGQVTVK
ncbi:MULTISPECIES: restriction endonuclease subunit S [Pectobacterium]|uniref:restriction endonuclease subunit S n=1 Tax=Pectobacterium TaxID=122277 RepID=UPI000651AAC7|nr:MULTISPECIES: restriction endonuclease subunit S [Pectobacterium]KMK84527.1 restriction modification system DNA specificity domain-containing protein [Pectobacterium brasiliense ICMP 19477]MCL6330389.1 restriction endonuclease subunit S [Pectobacterium carotovorum subsp. carotovorum]